MNNGLRTTDSRLVWLTVCGGTLLLVTLIVLAPVLQARGYSLAAWLIYRPLGLVCHQIPERSFYLADYPLAVCARCLGLYAGFGAGALVFPLWRSLATTREFAPPARRWLILALAPTIFDVGFDFVNWRENTFASRAGTGLLLGAALAFYVLPALISLAQRAKC